MGKAPLLEHGKMKKKPRGIYCYAKDAESDIELVRWHNNSIVTVASNCLRLMPFAPATRWSYQKKVDCGFAAQYGDFVQKVQGRMVRLDQNIKKLRIGIRMKKWW